MNSTVAMNGTIRPFAVFPVVCNGSWEFTEIQMYKKCCTYFGRGLYNNEDCLPYAKKVQSPPKTTENAKQVSLHIIWMYFCIFLVFLSVVYKFYRRKCNTRITNITSIQLTRTISKSTVLEEL